MKMKLLDRILLTMYTFVILLLSVVLLGISLRLLSLEAVIDTISALRYGWPFALIAFSVALIFFVLSLRLLMANFLRDKPTSTLLKATELGTIRVSVNTLDTLAQKAVRVFNEVKDVKSLIVPEPDGVRIQLKVTIMPDVNMPELTQSLQQKVKEYVENVSGITVKEVRIYVDNLSTGQRNRVE